MSLRRGDCRACRVLCRDSTNKTYTSLLNGTRNVLVSVRHCSPTVASVLTVIDRTLARIRRTKHTVGTCKTDLRTSPRHLRRIRRHVHRLGKLYHQFRHALPRLITCHSRIGRTLTRLSNRKRSVRSLRTSCRGHRRTLAGTYTGLASLHRGATRGLRTRLVTRLGPLTVRQIRFQISLRPTAPNPAKTSTVRFLFDPGPNRPLRPLTRATSKNRVDHFLLTLGTYFSRISTISALVFSRVSINMSNQITRTVTRGLLRLNRDRRILYIARRPVITTLTSSR